MKFVRLVFVAGSLALAGCANMTFDAPPNQCELGDDALVRDVLYFGRNRPTGGIVSDLDWQQFLGQVVTARFPEGLTVVEATGQWRGESGTVEQEKAEVVTIMHDGGDNARDAVRQVAEEYKRRFKQEAVLRERAVICARFQ